MLQLRRMYKRFLFKFFLRTAITSICVSSCASGGNGNSDLIDNSVTTILTGDQRYSFETFENKMTSPWGEVVFTYSVGEYRPSSELPSNEKYKIEDYGFLQVRAQGQHPGDDSNKDEISIEGPWYNTGQWFEANLNGDDFSDLIYVGQSFGTREFVPEDLMITFLNDGNGHFKIAPELFVNNSFPCVQGGTSWLNEENNDPTRECGNQQDYTNGKIVADFNGDGISDYYDTSILYLSNQGILENKSQSNLPDLFFKEGHGKIFVHDAAYGDLDSDGDLDIFTPIFDQTNLGYLFGGEKDPCSGCTQMIPFTALINDGTGNFSANHNFPEFDWLEVNYDNHGNNIDRLWPTTATIGDFDNDGYGDVAFGWFNPRISSLYGFSENSSGAVYLNNGSNDWTQRGFIELPANFFGDNGNANDMEAFDFDGDGYTDILLASTIHDPYYRSRVIQFFKNIDGESFIDVTEEKNPNYSIYTDGNPYSEMWAGQGKIHLVDYDHDGDIDVVDSSTRTYVLINNGDVFELYDNFVDLDEDWILWPIEIDNKFDYDFIGSFTDSNGRDYSLTTYFQVLDPQNEALLNNFLSKGSVYSEYILSSVNQYNEVRRSSRNKDFIYKDYEDSYVFGVNSNQSDYLNLFAGTAKGVLQGNFIGLSKEISAIRLGFIYTNNNPQNFNSNDLWGNSISNLEFKTGSAFVERSIAVNDLAINVGISYDKIFINKFEEKGNFLHLHFNSLNTLSQNVFVDIYYPFKIFGFTGSLNIGSSKRKFSSNFNLSSSESFELPSKISKTYTEGELSLVRGPLFLSIDYLEGKSPIFNIGFKLISY